MSTTRRWPRPRALLAVPVVTVLLAVGCSDSSKDASDTSTTRDKTTTTTKPTSTTKSTKDSKKSEAA